MTSRDRRKLLVVIGAVGFVYCACYTGFWLLDWDLGGYWSFLGKSKRYYTRFARACDSLLVAHPMGTNEFISIPVTDPSVSAIIRDLKPNRILLQSNQVWMMIGSTHAGFAVTWEPQPEGQSKVWAINSIAEGLVRTPYVEYRLIPSSASNPTLDKK
jgi:hypothetical protein